MIISNFRGSKGEDLQVLLKEYKKTYIGIGLRIIVKWFNFYPELLKGKTSHWFEQQIEVLKGSWNDITIGPCERIYVKNVN